MKTFKEFTKVTESEKKSKEEIKNILDDFDVSSAEKFLRNELDIDVDLGRTVQDIRGQLYMYLKSNDLSKEFGPMGYLLFKKIIVEMSGTLVDDGSIAFKVQFSYEHPSGGSNGLMIGNAWYTQDGKWVWRAN